MGPVVSCRNKDHGLGMGFKFEGNLGLGGGSFRYNLGYRHTKSYSPFFFGPQEGTPTLGKTPNCLYAAVSLA